MVRDGPGSRGAFDLHIDVSVSGLGRFLDGYRGFAESESLFAAG